MKYLITGGAGFIGSALIRHLVTSTDNIILNIDSLTYAGNLESLETVASSSRYSFEQVDICNFQDVQKIFSTYKPDIVMHLAAESHVDRSIEEPGTFLQTNIFGTYNLLEATRQYLASSSDFIMSANHPAPLTKISGSFICWNRIKIAPTLFAR